MRVARVERHSCSCDSINVIAYNGLFAVLGFMIEGNIVGKLLRPGLLPGGLGC